MRISDYGFVEVGSWNINEKLKSGIDYTFREDFCNLRVVYAFVVDNETKYVGVCEKNSTTLKVRTDRYKARQGRGMGRETRTNTRIAENIQACLKEGKNVLIFALEPKESYRYKGLDVDLVKGLENPLLQKFQPEWNK